MVGWYVVWLAIPKNVKHAHDHQQEVKTPGKEKKEKKNRRRAGREGKSRE
jgi:hypothetical protein